MRKLNPALTRAQVAPAATAQQDTPPFLDTSNAWKAALGPVLPCKAPRGHRSAARGSASVTRQETSGAGRLMQVGQPARRSRWCKWLCWGGAKVHAEASSAAVSGVGAVLTPSGDQPAGVHLWQGGDLPTSPAGTARVATSNSTIDMQSVREESGGGSVVLGAANVLTSSGSQTQTLPSLPERELDVPQQQALQATEEGEGGAAGEGLGINSSPS